MDALEHRNKVKARKPRFRKQDAHKHVKLNDAWRRPRGYQSKMRLNKRGYARPVSAGFGSPLAAYGLTRDGLMPVAVATLAQLDALNPKTQCAIFVATLGARKREQLLLRAKERKVKVQNAKDVDGTLKAIKESLDSRHKKRDERSAGKQKKTAKAKSIDQKVDKEAAEEKAEKTDEEKAEELEAEKQKVLTKGM